MKKLLSLLLTATIAIATLSSCDDRDTYYYSPLVGAWSLYSVDGYIIDEPDASEFVFNADGTGTFGQYSSWGAIPVWSTYQITWDTDFPGDFDNMLYVYTWDGQTWVYRYTVGYGQLKLWDTYTGQTLVYTPY